MQGEKVFIIFLLLAVLVVGLFGEGEKPSVLFESHEVLELTLAQDVKTMKKDVGENRTYHPAQLSYVDGSGRAVTLNVSIKTRGKTRRNPQLCDSPPLSVKFEPENTKGTLFQDQIKLKLVTHCKRKKELFEQYLLREYLVYRLYNILTPKSFRVRLVHMNYVDSGGKYKPDKRYAFFIESDNDMAGRNNGKPDDTAKGFRAFCNKEEQVMFSVFQFMIGNTDWSVPGHHNVKIFREGTGKTLVAVPYDFDMSGIVNARYARPHEKLQGKIKDVRTRWYRGLCRKQEEFAPVLPRFKKKKEKIYALYENFSLLDKRYKRATFRYLDEFYDIINKPRLVKKHLVENCRKFE